MGDHLAADIAGGKRAGLKTILVLTGTTSPEDLERAGIAPDLVLDSLAGLVGRRAARAPRDGDVCTLLDGREVPSLTLDSTHGRVGLAELTAGRLVLYVYPRTGVAGEPPLPGWDQIPGARGCTAQCRAFRDHATALAGLGARIAGLSAQAVEEQREFAARNGIPFPLVSDPGLVLARSLGVPTFTVGELRLYERVVLVVEQCRVVKAFYPVLAPEESAGEVVAWLEEHLADRPTDRADPSLS